MTLSFKSVVLASRDDVFAWHGRPGAIVRLTPPWLPVTVETQAADLRDGRAVLSVAGVWRWVAQHDPEAYGPPARFADKLDSAPLGLVRWRHTHLFGAANPAITEVEDRVETNIPEVALREMFAYRQRQLSGDMGAHAWARSLRPEPMTVAMTGSSGLIGTALRALLTTGGHRVVRLVRRAPETADERFWDVEEPQYQMFDGVDAVVHLAGKSIAGRFTEAHRRELVRSRVGPTRRLAEAAAKAKAHGFNLQSFISASAVGYYGPGRGDEVLREDSERGDGFLADLVVDWESAALPAAEAGLRAAAVRTGIVQSPRGGMLKVFYPLYLAGLGGRLGSGRQWVPWVGLDDIVDIYLRLLVDPAMRGPVNAVAPKPVTNRQYAATLGRVLRRPALLAVPAFAPAVVLNEEGAREFALAGQRAEPAALLAAGHRFRHADLETALRHLLGKWLKGLGQHG